MYFDLMEFFILIPILLIIYLIMPWINLAITSSLRRELRTLADRLTTLEETLKKAGTEFPAEKEPIIQKEIPKAEAIQQVKKVEEIVPKPAKEEPQFEVPTRGNLEQQFGMRLPVWIGGIALALGGFFLVKYSIEVGLLSPFVRVLLGIILGSALILFGQNILLKAQLGMSFKISQSLTGAGLVTLYGSFYAATTLYEILPNSLGFIALIATTALAITLSLRQGVPIAVLALLGGFMTPMMVSSQSPSAVILFGYLYILYVAIQFLARSKDWWWLMGLAAVASYVWVIFWLSIYGITADAFWISLFIIAVAITNLINVTKDQTQSQAPVMINIGIGLASLLLFTYVSLKTQFPAEQWFMYGILVIAGFAMTFFKESTYSYFPAASLAGIAIMLYSYTPAEVLSYLIVLGSFTVIYLTGSIILLRKYLKGVWAGLIFASSLVFYGLMYKQLKHYYHLEIGDFLWASLAIVFAVLAVYLLTYIKVRRADENILLSILAAMATTFVSIGLALVLSDSAFKLALVFEMLALFWLVDVVKLSILRSYGLILGSLFLILSLPDLFQMVIGSLIIPLLGQTDRASDLMIYSKLAAHPFMGAFVPGLIFLITSYLSRLQQEKTWEDTLRATGYMLTIIGILSLFRLYYDQKFDFITHTVTFIEDGLLINLCFGLSLSLLYLNDRYKDRVSYVVGLSLAYYALFKIGYTYLLLCNPIKTGIPLRGIPIFNTLVFPFALPILWSWLAASYAPAQKVILRGAAHVLTFIFLSFSVRSLYHFPDLSFGITSNAEIYTYSVVWLLYALGLMFYGILRNNSLIRYASLTLLLLTVGKVFLYDASQLVGIYRVLSFLGLGISLIGISYVYSRFVFKNKKDGS